MSKQTVQTRTSGMEHIQDDAVPMPSIHAEAMSGDEPSNTQPGGYPHRLMLNGKPDEKFCCGHCKLILRDPMQTYCGHRYCRGCLKELESSQQQVQCQPCISEGYNREESILNFQGCNDDRAVRREMTKLQVKCLSQGCIWKGTFDKFMEHDKICEKKLLQCPQCGANVSKAKLASHTSKNCPKRRVNCRYCGMEVMFDLREKHTEECSSCPVVCDKCKGDVERSKLLYHQETICTNRVISCPVPDCGVKLPFDKFMSHLTKDETETARHLLYLLDYSKKSDIQLKQLENVAPSHAFAVTDCQQAQSSASASCSEGSQIGAEARLHAEGAQADGSLFEKESQTLKLHGDLISVLHAEILRCINHGEAIERRQEKTQKRTEDCYTKIEAQDAHLNTLESKYKQISSKPVDQAEWGELLSEGNGGFTWVIPQYNKVKQQSAQHREKEMICSPTFFTCPGGYQMRLKLYPNGESDENRNKNVSLFVQTVKGAYDDLLLWPFAPKIQFLLIDQIDFRNHLYREYGADPMSPASMRPMDDASVAAGCPAFISINEMSRKMLKSPKDTVYLKFNVTLPDPNLARLNSLDPLKYSSERS